MLSILPNVCVNHSKHTSRWPSLPLVTAFLCSSTCTWASVGPPAVPLSKPHVCTKRLTPTPAMVSSAAEMRRFAAVVAVLSSKEKNAVERAPAAEVIRALSRPYASATAAFSAFEASGVKIGKAEIVGLIGGSRWQRLAKGGSSKGTVGGTRGGRAVFIEYSAYASNKTQNVG